MFPAASNPLLAEKTTIKSASLLPLFAAHSAFMSDTQKSRCPWPIDTLYIRYHDTEWGVPLHDDRKLFEFIILEGAQAGLSWHIILKKREGYRAAFDQFDPET